MLVRPARTARRAIGPIAVVVEDFAQHAAGRQPGHPGQIDGGLGVPGTAQHAAFLGHQRKQVARAGRSRPACSCGSRIARIVSAPLLGRDAGAADCDDRPAR